MKLRMRNLFMIAALLLLSSGCSTKTPPANEPVKEESSGQETDIKSETDENDEKEPGGNDGPDLSENDGPELSSAQETAQNHQDYEEEGREVALVTDVSYVMDHGFNEAAFQGIQKYADAAGISYSSYSTDVDTAESYQDTILAAIHNNAELVVCVGPHFEQAVGSLQNDYSDTYFLLLDGVPRDSLGEAADVEPNVHCVTYREEEAGYLVGYMSVLEGYKRFGFIGGEQLASVERYGYGYLRGIDDAAAFLGIEDEVQAEYWYADTFLPDRRIEEISKEWYEAGTEVIFACGGSLYESVLSSAAVFDGKIIGVDVDQSDISELILTSAMKGIDASIIVALDEFFANGRRWPEELAGQVGSYGAKEKCISLPVQDNAWRFKNATTSQYLQILARLRSGDIEIPVDMDVLPETSVTVIYHNQQEERDS